MIRRPSSAVFPSGLLGFLLVAAAAGLAPAWAHEGHEHPQQVAAPDHDHDHDDQDDDHAPPALPAAVTAGTRLEYQSPRIEAVAALDAQGLVIWVDGFDDNRPRSGLDVQVRNATRSLRAQESEPGTYRVPLDLLSADADDDDQLTMAVSIASAAASDHFSGHLPRVAAAPAAHQARFPPLLAALLIAPLLAAAVIAWRRRRSAARR